MIKRAILFGIIFSSLLLVACSSSSQASEHGNSPSSIDQELWDKSHDVVEVVKEATRDKSDVTDEQNNTIVEFADKYFVDRETFDSSISKDLTLEEEVLVLHTVNVVMKFRENIFVLDTEGIDRLTQTLVTIQEFEKYTETFKDD
ncbi:hypothetical protein BTR22_05305 [Alkalihalophilus pseudofirmus]|nr:hypothetical protein BTR22_05305 [Alkalihalophilus pseudofirmus]